MRKCRTCGQRLSGFVLRLYCGRGCMFRAQYARRAARKAPRPAKPCILCGRDFVPRRKSRYYCTDACRTTAAARRRRGTQYILRLADRLAGLEVALGDVVMDPALESVRSEVKALSTEQLRAEFASGLKVSAQHLTRLAFVLQELEARGELVADAPPDLLALLRRIARGELLADVLVQFAATPRLMRRVAALPVSEQRAIVADPKRQKKLLESKQKYEGGGQSRRDAEDKNPLIFAEVATPKDLAGMIAEMIGRNPRPADVWEALCHQPSVRRLLRNGRAAAC